MSTRIKPARIAMFGATLIASAVTVSAHVVKGLISPSLATAHVSSPTPGADAPVPLTWTHKNPNGTVVVVDTGLRVACFGVANTSTPRVDHPDWPRVTSVGFELPGSRSGFSLVAPLDDEWEIVEGRRAFLPNHGSVTLDFAIVARTNPAPWWPRQGAKPRGIPPGQPGVRGAGTRFCVSGPFPDQLPNVETPDPSDEVATEIEKLINGVVVGFHGVYGNRGGVDVGLWDNTTLRVVPLYPPSPE